MEKCIFCGEKNNGSDEHIIPDCINGKLHSKAIICHDCNSKKFGAKIDNVIKELFGPLMTTWGLKNGSGFHLETPEGTRFLMTKEGKTKHVKPEIDVVKRNGKTEIKVTGDSKNAVKIFEKQKKELLEKGYKEISIKQKEGTTFQSPLSTKWKLDTSPELLLLLNKIAVEFYAYNDLPIESISDLRAKLNELDQSIDNVKFCNFNEEIREFETKEISHLITIQNDVESKILFAYIELFNVICAVIPLIKDYKGDKVCVSYKQDVISGNRIDGDIILKKTISDFLLSDEPNLDMKFGVLVNKLTFRLREKEFEKIYKSELESIKEKLNKEVSEGKVLKENFVNEYLQRSTQMIAQLTLYDFPYMVEDFKDEENDAVNYIHSNLNDENYSEFCKTNEILIGREIDFVDEGKYIFDSFYKQPFLERSGINLVAVYCVLSEKDTGRKRYLPYRDFFEGIKVEEKADNTQYSKKR